jgi:ankyrin repeat protein
LNSKDNDGQTPLSWAVEKGNSKVMGLLLEKGAITLHTLIKEGEGSLVQRLLLDTKYDVNIKDSLGKTPLYIAISFIDIKTTIALISFKSIDVNLKDSDGITPLHLVIQIKCPDLIKLLLEKSTLIKNIIVNEWHEAYKKQALDIVILSKRESNKKFMCFIPEEEFLDKLT